MNPKHVLPLLLTVPGYVMKSSKDLRFGEKTDKTKTWYFDKIKKIYNYPGRLNQKTKNTQIIKIRNERTVITSNIAEILNSDRIL